MSAPHADLCDADDCPCFLAGQNAAHQSYAERSDELVEAMTRLIEQLTTEEDTEVGPR